MKATGVTVSTGAFIGSLRAVIGSVNLQEFPVDGLFPGTSPPNSSWEFTKTLMLTGSNAAMRGTTQTLKLQGRRVAGVGTYTVTQQTVVTARVDFGEEAQGT